MDDVRGRGLGLAPIIWMMLEAAQLRSPIIWMMLEVVICMGLPIIWMMLEAAPIPI